MVSYPVPSIRGILVSLITGQVGTVVDPTWHTADWSETIPAVDGCVVNVKQLLAEEEINY